MIGPGKWTFSGNVVSEVDQTYWSKNPVGNTYKVTIGELGLQPDGSAPSFPGVGADITLLNQKTSGVIVPAAIGARPHTTGRPRRYVPTKADSTFCKLNAC